MSIEVNRMIDLDRFRLELLNLSGVDWRDFWNGPPSPDSGDLPEWLAGYGWSEERVDRDLGVRSRHGSLLHLNANGNWRPVVSLSIEPWQADAGAGEDKGRVALLGEEEWEGYLQIASEVFGSPEWAGKAGADDFPDPPQEDLWLKPVSPQGDPYRLAFWRIGDVSQGFPYVLLWLTVSDLTWESWGNGMAVLSMEFIRPSGRR